MPTTASGTVYTLYTTTLAGGNTALYGISDSAKALANRPLILYCHGNGGAYNQFSTSIWSGLRDRLVDRGFAWAECNGGGIDSWGNNVARTDYQNLYSWVISQLSVRNVVILGRSMGALVAYWLASESPVVASHVSGLLISSGVTDLSAYMGPPPGKSYIRDAYGLASDGTGWDAWLNEYDPMRYANAAWSGWRVMQTWGTADTTVPPAAHAQAWVRNYGKNPAMLYTRVRDGGDHTPENGTYLEVEPMADFISSVTGTYAGAIAPTLAVPVGASYFDSTLNKPIWSTGSVWKDATGATV